MKLESLVIETTRRCNMKCEHCCRGNAQRLNINPQFITSLLRKVEFINTVTFSGGEPSLNVPAIQHFISECKRLNVEVQNFYIATNGTNASREFIEAIMDLHLLCSDNEISSVDISNDEFHSIDENVVRKLSVFNFVHKRYDKPLPYDAMMNEGRFHDVYNMGRNIERDYFQIEEDTIQEGTIYLNCKGNVIAGCNFSYKHQDSAKNIICHVDDFNIDQCQRFTYKEVS